MKTLATRIYQWLKANKWIQIEGIRRQISRLYRGTAKQTEEAVDTYYISIFQRLIWIMLIVVAISVVLGIQEYRNAKAGIHFTRANYGEEEETYTLTYRDEDMDWHEFAVTLEPVRYDPETLELQFQQGFTYLEEHMLGENVSLGEIQKDLNLQTSIPDSGLTVAWSSEDYELLNEKGVVNNANLTEATSVRLQLELSYEDITESREYELIIQPKAWTEEELMLQQLQAKVEAVLQESPYEKEVYLPEDMEGITLRGTEKQGFRSWLVFGFGVGICILLWFRQRENLYNKVKQQKRELLQEYPNFVNQLLLYMEAGATVKSSMERILQQYEKAEKSKKALYQELRVMWNEMHGGVAQEQAYINLGKRTGLLSYMKLTSMLVQQIRKGTGGIAEQLEQEEHAAFENRKEQAKKAGEEAGTKLLLPMILLMIISMIIVVCPALMNFMV